MLSHHKEIAGHPSQSSNDFEKSLKIEIYKYILADLKSQIFHLFLRYFIKKHWIYKNNNHSTKNDCYFMTI